MVDEDKKINNDIDDSLDLGVSDEIVVRDKDGTFKVLIGGKLAKLDGQDIKAVENSAKTVAPPQELFQKEGIVPEEEEADRLMPPPPTPWQKQAGAAFYFHPEDEEEVQELATAKDLGEVHDISFYVGRVVKESGLSLPNEERQKKLRNIITSYLKQVRDRVGARSVLIEVEKNGGVGLDEATADKLLNFASQALEEIESGEGKKAVPASGSAQPENELDKLIKQSDDIYDFSSSQKKEESVGDKAVTSQDMLAEEITQTRPEFIKEPKFVEPEPSQSAPVNTPPPQPAPPKIRTVKPVSDRPQMADVVSQVKLRGPIEELKYMSLTEIRRIGTNSLDNISRIKDKIDSLEDESFTKKVEGIKAWRQSPLYNLYVLIGRASMEQGKSVSQVIADKEKIGEETLTLPEFEKITDLNQELRY